MLKFYGQVYREPLQKDFNQKLENILQNMNLGAGGKKNSLYAGNGKSRFGKLSVEKQKKISEHSKKLMAK
jgi:hypothetical protein